MLGEVFRDRTAETEMDNTAGLTKNEIIAIEQPLGTGRSSVRSSKFRIVNAMKQ
jgi:hypothetical protein